MLIPRSELEVRFQYQNVAILTGTAAREEQEDRRARRERHKYKQH